MKIEFRKIPMHDTEFSINEDSVDFTGIFSKISSKIAKLDSTISGELNVECCKCGESFKKSIDEKLDLLLSDGIYKTENNEDNEERIVIEVEDHFVDFEEILNSELESLKSDFHICENCTDKEFVEVEF